MSTLGLDDQVWECVSLLNDEKLSGGDLIALEAKYHTQCLSMLYRKAQYANEEGEESEQPCRRLDGIALAELVSYIEVSAAKEIQWNWSGIDGEEKFVVMFGSLHIEMAFLKVVGGWLEGSGWTSALVDTNVAIPGTAESFIKAASVTRCRRAH